LLYSRSTVIHFETHSGNSNQAEGAAAGPSELQVRCYIDSVLCIIMLDIVNIAYLFNVNYNYYNVKTCMCRLGYVSFAL